MERVGYNSLSITVQILLLTYCVAHYISQANTVLIY